MSCISVKTDLIRQPGVLLLNVQDKIHECEKDIISLRVRFVILSLRFFMFCVFDS